MGTETRSGRVVLVRIGIIAAVALSLTGCLKSKSPSTTNTTQNTTANTAATSDTSTTPTVSDLTSILPSSFDTDITAHFTQGTTAAKAWHTDAVVSYVSVALGSNLTPKKGNEVYVFGSASDLDNWFTYSLSQDTGKSVRAIIPKADYLGDKITPINTAYWSMNYIQALQLAEQNGGATFRTANPNPQITIFLSNRTPRGWLWWTVEYTAASSGQSLSLLINPYLGGVSDEQGNVLVPDGTSPVGSSVKTTTSTTSTTTQ